MTVSRFRILRLVLPVAVVVILALWLGQDRPVETGAGPNDTDPDITPPESWSRGLRTTQYTDEGNVRYVLEASDQVQQPDGRIRVTAPLVRLYEGQRQSWRAQAAFGTIREGDPSGNTGRQLELTDDVRVDYNDEEDRELVLTTQRLTVYPDDELLLSDVAVIMRGSGFEQTSAGMRAAMQEEELTFFGRVQGRFHNDP